MGKRKKITMITLAVLCIFLVMPGRANAAKLKKVNVDKYLSLGKNYTLLAYNPGNKWVGKGKKAEICSCQILYADAELWRNRYRRQK